MRRDIEDLRVCEDAVVAFENTHPNSQRAGLYLFLLRKPRERGAPHLEGGKAVGGAPPRHQAISSRLCAHGRGCRWPCQSVSLLTPQSANSSATAHGSM